MTSSLTRRRVLGLGAGALPAMVAGCGGDGDSESTQTTTLEEVGPMRAALSLPNTTAPFNRRLAGAFESAKEVEEEEEDAEITPASTVHDAGGDPATQADHLATAAEEAAFIIVRALDDPAVQSAIQDAADSVPVCSAGPSVAPDATTTTATTSQSEMAAQSVNLLLDPILEDIELRNRYRVIEIAGPPETNGTETRSQAIDAVIADLFTMSSLGSRTVAASPDAAETAVVELLEAAENPVHGIITHRAPHAIGAHRAVTDRDRPIGITTVGRSTEWFDLIVETAHYGSIVPSAGWMIYTLIQAGVLAASGGEPGSERTVGGTEVTMENVAEFR